MQGRIGQHSGIGFELVRALDVPVLQMVEQPVEVDSFFRNFVPAVAEQVIEVPMLALPGCAVQRAALSEPQTVEQLVEVPTVLSYSLLQQLTAEQIIDFPVPGRGGGARGGLQGLPQGQGSTASAGEQTIVPVRGGLQGFPKDRGSTAFAGEQTIVVDRGGLQGFSEDRVPQRLPLSRPPLLIVFKVFPEDRVPQRPAVEQTFSQAPHRSMPRACQPRLGGLPAQGRHDEWVCVVDVENGGEYFWNRLNNSSCWRLPRGVKHRWCLLPSGLYRDVVSQVDYRVLPPSLITSRCSASWPVWTRRTLMPLVILVVMTHLALYFSSVSGQLCISASMEQKDRYASVTYARLVCWLRCAPRGSLLFDARPRCLASRPVCFRRTVMRCVTLHPALYL